MDVEGDASVRLLDSAEHGSAYNRNTLMTQHRRNPNSSSYLSTTLFAASALAHAFQAHHPTRYIYFFGLRFVVRVVSQTVNRS